MPDSSPSQNNAVRPLDAILPAFDDGTLTREEVERLVHFSRRAAVLSTTLAATIQRLTGLSDEGVANAAEAICNQAEGSEMTQQTLALMMSKEGVMLQ